MAYARAALGLAVLLAIAWALSSHRRRVPWRVIGIGLSLQIVLGLIVLRTATGRAAFEAASDFFLRLLTVVEPAATLLFGQGLAQASGEFGPAFAFAGRGLVVIIFFSALMSILYHLGIMQLLIRALARALSASMGVSGAESMAVAANVFVGQTEAPLVIRPYLPGMTLSELNALMTGGFATIAGSVLAVYVGLIGPELAPHLLTASVMSAPAAFVIAKIMQPETEVSQTAGRVELVVEREARNVIEAAANGTQVGLKLWLNIVAMLIAFIALVHLINWPLSAVGEAMFGMDAAEPAEALTLARLFGWILAPLAWIIGIEGWHDAQLVGALLGTKIAINEFVAFVELNRHLAPDAAVGFEDGRSAQMVTYALCGFANFGSIGIQLGGLTPLAPDRRGDLSRLALRAMGGGALASLCTATIAGVFI